MNWNTTKGDDIDNLQVFVVFKYTTFKTSPQTNINDGVFGNAKDSYDRFVGAYKNDLIVGGVRKTQSSDDGKSEPDYLAISHFPDDATPMTLGKFSVLSIDWNNKGLSGCGTNASSVRCNGNFF